jgi:hypothetical protein
MKEYDWRRMNKLALLGLNTYLILSLNFVGIFAQGPPNQRLHHQNDDNNEVSGFSTKVCQIPKIKRAKFGHSHMQFQKRPSSRLKRYFFFGKTDHGSWTLILLDRI